MSTVGLGTGALYSASKAAVEQLARGWAAEFGRHGVRVNTVAPGVTLTEGPAGYEARLAPLVKALPGGRFATPDDIARGVVYLASDDASYVHGATLVVDGGALATRT